MAAGARLDYSPITLMITRFLRRPRPQLSVHRCGNRMTVPWMKSALAFHLEGMGDDGHKPPRLQAYATYVEVAA